MSAVNVEEYNSKWASWFESLKNQLLPSVKEYALSIEHVGSTSIPGLLAKPVIDMDIVIDNVKNLNPIIRALESLGYTHRGNLGIEGREAFRIPAHQFKHNLYVCLQDCTSLKNHLILRDHLRSHPEARNQYGELKRRLANTSLTIDEYVEGKTSFIVDILSKNGMDAKDLEAIKNSNQASNKKLVIKNVKQKAELWQANQLIKVYKISTALNGLGCQEGSFCTPTGKLKVASKIGGTLPFGGVLRSRIPSGEIWSPDSSNPLSNSNEDLVLTRLLWLEGAEDHNSNTFKRYIYLHGTNQEHLLGKPASHGCIRFSNQDILEIFNQLQAGNEVEVL